VDDENTPSPRVGSQEAASFVFNTLLTNFSHSTSQIAIPVPFHTSNFSLPTSHFAGIKGSLLNSLLTEDTTKFGVPGVKPDPAL
jgi:hypothetical protein